MADVLTARLLCASSDFGGALLVSIPVRVNRDHPPDGISQGLPACLLAGELQEPKGFLDKDSVDESGDFPAFDVGARPAFPLTFLDAGCDGLLTGFEDEIDYRFQ